VNSCWLSGSVWRFLWEPWLNTFEQPLYSNRLSPSKKMQRSFNEVVEQIIDRDPRYDKEAYIFLKEALEFTIKQKKRGKTEAGSHVNAGELLDGFRQLALKEFGPMVMTVLEYWGVRASNDVGEMVFNLIGAGVFGKTESDTVEDFHTALDFRTAFVAPFEPRGSRSTNP
jgi:uncharacterized repeat protein (TIGR04138 family)